MQEIWLPAVGRPEGTWYQVSNLGNVRGVTGKVLKPWLTGNNDGRNGVVMVALGRSKRVRVSHLVLETFGRPRPAGTIALHWDDNPWNNADTNLRWGTFSDNLHDSVRNGHHAGANKTECVQGHRLDGIKKNGKRYCKTCEAIWRRNYRANLKAGIKNPRGRPRKE